MSVASPESTGHAGTSFEQHVDAAFLGLLLVRGVPPFLIRSEIVELHLQSGHLGWAMDDLLVVTLGIDGRRRSAALSIKRTLSIAKSDRECVDVFAKAWSDFKSTRFNAGLDVVGLVTRPCAETMMRGLRVLLETARGSLDGADFMRRLSLPGYRDKTALEYAKTIREIVEGVHSCAVTEDELYAFLKSFDFVCLDLNSPSSATEALLMTLLRAHAAPNQNAAMPGEVWAELIRIVSTDSQTAKSYRWEEIPGALRERLSVAMSHVEQFLEPFSSTTQTVCDGVDTMVGGHHEPRADLEQQAIDILDANQVLIIGGLAGAGKSAVAKGVFDAIIKGRFGLALRAEMLARPTIGESLVASGTTLSRLRALMALHPDKVIWIDGAERLLEKRSQERDAFNDVMRIVKNDPSWRVLITCRSYSLETFRAAFLEQNGIESRILWVPVFQPAQLDAFMNDSPQLVRPLSNPELRSLLANPFFLKMAARMKWDPAESLPANEREFRRRVWRQWIRRDDEAADAMPLKRDETYINVALRRARSFDAFVEITDFDKVAISRLEADTLLFESEDVRGRYAPAHDVLEDWALLEWLDREYERSHKDWSTFLDGIGTHPAIRRTFRAWMTDRIETEPAALRAVGSLVVDRVVPGYWTDDALVAVLRSADPEPFFREHGESLLADNAQLLQRAIHLARVACKQQIGDTAAEIAAGLQRPVGLVWRRLAEFVGARLESAVPQCAPLLLRFIEDWCGQVTWSMPYPAGSAAVSAIAGRLLDDLDVHAYSRNEEVERVLKVLTRMPREAADRIKQINAECLTGRFRTDEPFVEVALGCLSSGPLCRDLPEVVIAAIERLLAPAKARAPEAYPYGHRESLAERFGLRERVEHYGHPASAYHGPFLHLLRFHPSDGLRLIIDTINRCSAVYLAQYEEPLEASFDLPSGTVLHRGDGVLWAMYRTNPGPNVLRSMLMAMETWLLEFGDRRKTEFLHAAVLRVMETGNSLALSAVIASVVMAFPDQLGEIGVTFLKNRGLFYLDRGRWIADQSSADKMIAENFAALSAETRFYNQERVEAADRKHRHSHFELLAWQLQTSGLCDQVHAVLDAHMSMLPAIDEQDDEDRLWRLLLHRIDSRNVAGIRDRGDGRAALELEAPPADVQAVVDRDRPQMEATHLGLAVYLWGQARYKCEDEAKYPASAWRTQLEHVRTRPPVPFSDARLIVATVCLRDCFTDLITDERIWCLEILCAAFQGDVAHGGAFGFGPLSGVREAARELAGVWVKLEEANDRARVGEALVRALVVDEHDISRQAAIGVGWDLWNSDRGFATSLATTLHRYYHREALIAQALSRRRSWPREESARQEADAARDRLKSELVASLPAREVDMAAIAADDFRKSPGRFIVRELSDMMYMHSNDPDARAFIGKLVEQLVATWEAEWSARREEREGFDYQTEPFICQVVCGFALGLVEQEATRFFEPICGAAAQHPEEVAKLLRALVSIECDRHRPTTFWALWRVLSTPLIQWVNGRPNASEHVLDAIAEGVFLGLRWNETLKSWRSMTGHEPELEQAFGEFRACEESIDWFTHYLSTIGAHRASDILPLLARKLTEPDAVLSDRAVSRLEKSLAQLIYSGMPRIRQEHELRDATLGVLGILIEAGSSRAYRMRDDFLTPLRTEAI